jgi:hypothetical protein
MKKKRIRRRERMGRGKVRVRVLPSQFIWSMDEYEPSIVMDGLN